MKQNRLRVYYGPEARVAAATEGLDDCADNVTLPLVEIFPLLAHAAQNQQTWLADFEDDEITISSDLYEVILAYQHCRRPSA